jgi:putative methyltransferase (TIGR04325 family)
MRELIAHVAARALPPVISDLLRQAVFRLKLAEPKRLFQGVYRHVRDVPPRGPGYEDGMHRAEASREVARLMRLGGVRPTALDDEAGALLSLLIAAATVGSRDPLRIVDFGGGPGLGYAQITSGLASRPFIDYHVVELPSVCADGRRLFGDDPHIHFHSSIPSRLEAVDLVYAAGALEVIDDWQGVLRTLCRLEPRWVLLSGVCCGDFETFATAFMAIKGSAIPVWLLNVHAIVDVMTDCGYYLLFRTLLERVHAQDNFPVPLRLPGGHPSALLFRRRSPAPDAGSTPQG